MKADLAKREPAWLERWRKEGLYAQMLAQPAAKDFVFHDGPPYANGELHYGHVLNNVLKDFVTRSRTMLGERTLMVPGWDCHGLPIELNVDKRLGSKKRELTALQLRDECAAEARKWIAVQSEGRQRLGMLGTWEDPYLTMKPAFEAKIIGALEAFARKGLVYRGLRPVQWCAKDRTALAEAEVEYLEKHRSPSVYVKFAATEPAASKLRALFAVEGDANFSAVIWTTTPWTLPANLAIAAHAEVQYALLEVERAGQREAWLLAVPLLEAVQKACRVQGKVSAVTVPGSALAGLAFAHPFEARESGVVLAEYVTTDAGTGLVHTAPGHGRDDYQTGLKNKLEPYAPVDDAGRFNNDLGEGGKALGLVGKSVWEANPLIARALAEKGALCNEPTDTIEHKYPGCWRCHQPLLTRATSQWFIALDKPMEGDPKGHTLRQRALEEIDRLASEHEEAKAREGSDAVGWVPALGRERIHGMISQRPDWCISRQRVWGVPIPALHCDLCGHPNLDGDLLAHVGKLFGERGAGVWYDDKAQVVPDGFACRACGSKGQFTRDKSILDVWFESGSSFYAVCHGREHLGVPVDLYLEGSDQHRGWFHSSLLVGVAVLGRAPYRAVVTHGFILTETGVAMSKSFVKELKDKGEDVSVFDPNVTIKTLGAEQLRCWVAYSEFREDLPFGKRYLEQVTDQYRKVRNALRFLLQALRRRPGPALESVRGQLEPLDRWALGRVERWVRESLTAYRRYEFRSVFAGAAELLGELSALWFDASKDWLYNDAEDSPRRRSTLAVMDASARYFATVLAPLVPFTAEDVWDHLPRREGDPKSVHLCRLAEPPATDAAELESLEDAMRALRALRDRVHGALEPKVQAWGAEKQAAKKAGREPGSGERVFDTAEQLDHARDAEVVVPVEETERKRLEPLAGVLGECLLVGELELAPAGAALVVRRGSGAACARCWRRRRGVESSTGLCVRCTEAVRRYDQEHGAGR